MICKTCFFIENRHTPVKIKGQLIKVVEKHITEYDVKTFVVGHYGSFDRIVTEVLKDLKKKYPHIKVYLLAPYALTQKVDVPKGFDGSFYPDGMETVPKPFAIIQANKKMIDNSGYLIAYCRNIAGNTYNFVEYAKKREKRGLIQITLL